MSKSTKERIYDREIAPLMAQIIEICEEHGIDMYAAFKIGGRLFCTTYFFETPPPHPALRMAYYAVASFGNFDLFMSAMRKDAAEYGHGSVELSLMGIPESPDTNIEGVKK